MDRIVTAWVGTCIAVLISSAVSADPDITLKLNDAELTDGAVIERIDDVLITTTNSESATLAGQLSARNTDQLDMSKIALPVLDPVYIGVTAGQEHFRLSEDNCTTKQLAPGSAAGSSCDVTVTPRATKPGFFTGKLQVKAGTYQTEIPLSGQARNFCAPDPQIMMTSSCSQPCGGGTQTTTFTDGCGATWTDTAACNTQACDAYNWNTSQYGNCSEVCNGGIQFRDVWCERFSDGARVADNFCQDDLKPAGSAQCNTMTCYRDYKVCSWIPDIPVELAYRGYRLQVVDEDNPDAYRYVSSTCEPDPNESTPIDDRITGCEAVHYDYPNDQVSYGGARWFVTETDEPLTKCIESTDIVYPWTLVAASWDERDEELIAYQERQYVIEVNGKTLPMTMPAVHEGEEPVDYLKVSNELFATSEFEYGENDPCKKYQKTKVVDIYERPDGSLYYDRTDEYGEPELVDNNVCESVIVWQNPTNSHWGVSFGYGHNSILPYRKDQTISLGPSARCGTSTGRYARSGWSGGSDGEYECDSGYVRTANHCSYTNATATRTFIRDDGQMVGQAETRTCSLVNSAPSVYTSTPDRSCDSRARYLSPGYAGFPTMTASAKQNCLNSWNW